jgi:hypothetical protein
MEHPLGNASQIKKTRDIAINAFDEVRYATHAHEKVIQELVEVSRIYDDIIKWLVGSGDEKMGKLCVLTDCLAAITIDVSLAIKQSHSFDIDFLSINDQLKKAVNELPETVMPFLYYDELVSWERIRTKDEALPEQAEWVLKRVADKMMCTKGTYWTCPWPPLGRVVEWNKSIGCWVA